MFNISTLPTDSLYKFLTLSGVLMFLAGVYGFFWVSQTTSASRQSFEADYAAFRIDRKYDLASIQLLQKRSPKDIKTALALNERKKSIERRAAVLTSRQKLVRQEDKKNIVLFQLLAGVCAYGFVFGLGGMIGWKRIHQNHADLMMEAELDKAREEAQKAKYEAEEAKHRARKAEYELGQKNNAA
jgi:hypothetical protein